MKRVGICTINDNDNYGNRLQNFASQELLKKYEVQPETIINTTIHYKKEQITLKNFFPKLIRKVKFKINNIFIINGKRKKCFDDFNKNVVFYSKEINDESINNKSINEEINSHFDLFFTGSDQVWNPTFPRTSSVDFLSFTEKEKRNSLSASFGVNSISSVDEEKYKKWLLEMNNISVREEKGKEIVERLTGRNDVEVLIDPTMAIDKDTWSSISKEPEQFKRLKKKKYILNYFLGKVSNERKKEIQRIAKENNCEIINLLDKHSPFYQTGPSEFLFLEKNAFLICTDSFHSCVFAIIFNKPFIVFNREDSYENMNSRLETLLNKFNLSNRYFKGRISKDLLIIDYSNTYEILDDEKRQVEKYIKKCIAGKGEIH